MVRSLLLTLQVSVVNLWENNVRTFLYSMIFIGIVFMPKISFSNTINIKLPIFIDGKISLSSESYLHLKGEKISKPWMEFVKKNTYHENISIFLNSLEKSNKSLFEKVVNKKSFIKYPITHIDYFNQFSKIWKELKDVNIFSIIKYNDITFVILSAKYKSINVFPTICFKYFKDNLLLIPDDNSYEYQLLALWSSRLPINKNAIIPSTKIINKDKFIYRISKNEANPSLNAMKFIFSLDFFKKESKLLKNILSLKSLSKNILSSKKVKLTLLKDFFSKKSFNYLQTLSEKQRKEYISDISEINPINYIAFGNGLYGVYSKREVSNIISLTYILNINNTYKIVNTGHGSPTDSLLLQQSFISNIINKDKVSKLNKFR